MDVIGLAAAAALLVLLALAATVPPLPNRRMLARVAVVWLSVVLMWAASGSGDCLPGCTSLQDLLGWLAFVGIPIGGVLLFAAAVLHARLSRPARQFQR